jgi:hypothetical protein
MATTFSNKVAILADVYSNHRYNEALSEFVGYNDLGLPLAYLTHEGLSNVTEQGTDYINETFDMLLGSIGTTDLGFNNLDEVFLSK